METRKGILEWTIRDTDNIGNTRNRMKTNKATTKKHNM
jgi:hypothetical protein